MTAGSPTPLPAGLVGAWARESIAVGGDDPTEPQVVRYLQAGRAYADLRLPVANADGADADEDGAVACFAGHTAWDAPWATWHHDVDLAADGGADGPVGGVGAVDRGEIEWLDGGRMAERGTFASPAGPLDYVEVWRPLPVGPGGLLALRGADLPARLVQVGDHALVVCDRRADGGGFAARYDRWHDRGWHAVLALGEADALPAPPPPAAAARPLPGAVIELGGLKWSVDESSASIGPRRPAPAATP